MKTNKFISFIYFNTKLMATISISMILFLFGLVVFFLLFENNLSSYVKENLSFDIILNNRVNKGQIFFLRKNIYGMPFAKSVNYIPKEQGISELIEEIDGKQNPQEFLGFNPLPDLILVRLNHLYANIDSLVVIKKYLKKFSNIIGNVEYREKELKIVTERLAKINFIFTMIALISLVLFSVLINNTIKAMVYSKRFFIRTMKFIGASDWFIHKQFLSYVFIGIIASFIACAELYELIKYMKKILFEMKELFDLVQQKMIVVYTSVFISGILITFLASFFSIKKYIDMKINKLSTI